MRTGPVPKGPAQPRRHDPALPRQRPPLQPPKKGDFQAGSSSIFAGFVRRRPATISDNPGMDLEPLELFLLHVVLDVRDFCVLEID
ncbi:unnamed protein product [Prunus brigantina]